VVKADAYGHGAIEVADCLSPVSEWLATAQVHEAVELRRNGISNPILVFAPPLEREARLYKEYRITAVVSDVAHLGILKPGTEFHLHVDTGMRRTGILPESMVAFQTALDRRPDLDFTGLMTHFATAEHPDTTFFDTQLARFEPFVERFGQGRLVHAANSGTILMRPDARFDATRPGIALYGIDPAPAQRPQLQPALTWESFLIQVKPIRKGETVSYGATWAAPDDGYYGVVPVGYRDGLMRSLSGRISLGLPDRYVPQVGTITMDACMVWLGSRIEKAGTPVVIYDPDAIQIRKWAAALGSISYELLCAIGDRVERRYTD
jgi:alanine racemase